MKEGDIKYTKMTCKRRECNICEEPADFIVTFLYENARGNPASSAYGKDDCTWCSDEEYFSCKKHEEEVGKDAPRGMKWCSTFSGEKFPHLILFWHKEELSEDDIKVVNLVT